MVPAARVLRFVQLACIVLVLASAVISILGRQLTSSALTGRHWLVLAAACYSAVSGFTMQRRIVRRKSNSASSTPLTRWRAGHLIRLMSATTAGISGLLFFELAGPIQLVYVLLAAGLLLLLSWTPGSPPSQNVTIP